MYVNGKRFSTLNLSYQAHVINTTVAPSVRVVYAPSLSPMDIMVGPDVSWVQGKAAIWTVVEMNLAISRVTGSGATASFPYIDTSLGSIGAIRSDAAAGHAPSTNDLAQGPPKGRTIGGACVPQKDLALLEMQDPGLSTKVRRRDPHWYWKQNGI